jgi:hypothetical protein
MANHDQTLKLYADNGMRTQEEWTSMGRNTQPGAAARVEISHKGKTVGLYTRDQTSVRPRAPRKPRVVVATVQTQVAVSAT